MDDAAWMRRVANLLGFREMPPELAPHAEYFRAMKASTDFAAESLREYLVGPVDRTGAAE